MRKLKTDELNRLTVEDFKSKKKNPLVLILDNVRSLHNVGSAFRTADAFLVEKIYLCGITGRPPHRDITKTAIGATESVDWEYAKETQDVVQELISAGYEVIAVEQVESSISLKDFQPDPTKKYALIFGNEVFGVDQDVVKLCANTLEIPQFGTKHSLNVSVSVGVVLWDLVVKMGLTEEIPQ